MAKSTSRAEHFQTDEETQIMLCVHHGTRSKGAERARRHRQRQDADLDRRRKYLEKERDRWKKDIETGKKKVVNKPSERDNRAKQKKWREAKTQARARNRASALLQSETPPNSSVELFFVPEWDIEPKTEVPAIAAVKGTMKIHQATSLTPGQVKYRDISCLCKREEGVLDCPCFNLQEVTLADVPVSSDESPACVKTPDKPGRPEMIEGTTLESSASLITTMTHTQVSSWMQKGTV
ncbi:uncharacterized protein LOC126385475 [Epinephelus moara]|uniref:uncharacterized protein LOC126385475 n=1 Tax=Epinephelus moara TaxID=300413 RepID=UPI00214F2AC9|nr:uncharacterized protein LOC126385475 [Epinephelus moara]